MSDFDAIVIGSGFGGAVAACRLVEHGKKICVLERGRRYSSQPPGEVDEGARPWSSFPDLPAENDAIPDPKRWAWGDEQGLWQLRNLDRILAVQAAGYGGGSLVYANVHLRAPAEVFRGWPFTRADLDDYYDVAAYMLNAKPITERGPTPEKTKQFEAAAKGLERQRGFFYPPLAVSYDGQNAFGREQAACNDCGECITGCRYRAKNTLDFNYLALVDDSPLAEVRTQAEAVSIAADAGGGYRVAYRDHLRGRDLEVTASRVFVCAGAVNTTELLLRSKGGLPNLNHTKLGASFCPNADFPSIVYDARTPEQEPRLLGPTRGPTITASLYHQPPPDPAAPSGEVRPWCLVQEGGFPIQMARHMGVFRAPALMRRNRHDDRASSPIKVVPGECSPGGPLLPPACDPPLLRSLLDGLYALLENEGDLFGRIAPGKLKRAIEELEKQLTAFEHQQVEETVEAIRERVLSHGVLKWILPRFVADRLLPVEAMTAYTQEVLQERYLGRNARERVELATRLGSWLLRFDDEHGAHSQNAMILLGMGPDLRGCRLVLKDGDGELKVETEDGWDAPLSETESLMRDVACALGGKLRVNPLWSFARRQVTVHSQGGCPMSSDDEPNEGVTNQYGEVRGHPDLYVMDAAAFPKSIGVNPSATIAAVAERNMAKLLGPPAHLEKAKEWWAAQAWKDRDDVGIEPRRNGGVATVNHPVGIEFREHMLGFHSPNPVPGPDSAYWEAEVRGREQGGLLSIDELTARVEDVAAFIPRKKHDVPIRGTATLVWDDAGIKEKKTYDVAGTLTLPESGPKTGERRMVYKLEFRGTEIVLTGFKRIRNDPGTDVWRDTSRLLTTLTSSGEATSYGVLHVALDEFLFDQLPSFRVLNTEDPARIAWTLASFGTYFFGHLQRIYLPQLRGVVEGFTNLGLR